MPAFVAVVSILMGVRFVACLRQLAGPLFVHPRPETRDVVALRALLAFVLVVWGGVLLLT